jgi:hypothetical protein
MRAFLAGCFAAALAHGADAADRVVTMITPSPVAKGVAAMPRIAGPVDAAERRINVAVRQLDGSVAKAAAECRRDAEGPAAPDADWSRQVEVTMAGPRYLSYVITDDAFCGGAHPATGTMSIVYDLGTGRPVDWATLLPPALVGKLTLQAGMDGTRTVALTSPGLHALYLKGYGATAMGHDADCRDAVAAGSESPPLSVWLDARAGGLAVQFDLAHVVQACALAVVIPAAALAAAGANPELVRAIAAAHARH